MSELIEAVYENGAFHPLVPLSGLTEGQRLTISVDDADELRRRETAFLDRMKNEGRIVPSPPLASSAHSFEPLRVEGEPVSQTILQDRI